MRSVLRSWEALSDVLGPEIILVRGCEIVAGKFSKQQQEPTSPDHVLRGPGPSTKIPKGHLLRGD